MNRLLLTFASIFFLAGLARADDWLVPRVQTQASENGAFLVRMAPSEVTGLSQGQLTGKHASAQWFRWDGKDFVRQHAATLLNPVSPVEIRVANNGALVSFDNWGGVGTGAIVAIYAPNGKLVRSYTLDQLYPAAAVRKFRRTVSSVHWRCHQSLTPGPDGVLTVHDSSGGYLDFKLANGSVIYHPTGGLCASEAGDR